MSKVIDITGQRFGNIVITKRVQNDKNGQAQFEYLCDCGKIKIGRGKDIRAGKITSCGCRRGIKCRKNISGQTYGELTAIQYEYSKNTKTYWSFQCSCGKTTIKAAQDVINGKTRSCGCKTNMWRSISHKIIEEPGTIYNFLKVEETALPQEQKGDSEYWCTCLLCGSKVRMKSTYFRSGSVKSCGCLISYQEEKIKQFLEQQKIKYIRQYTFNDLRSDKNKKLRFDFAILNEKDELAGLIEYNGQQHYEENNFFGKQQREVTDQQKINYCKKNNIPLLILNKNNILEKEILNFYNEVM